MDYSMLSGFHGLLLARFGSSANVSFIPWHLQKNSHSTYDSEGPVTDNDGLSLSFSTDSPDQYVNSGTVVSSHSLMSEPAPSLRGDDGTRLGSSPPRQLEPVRRRPLAVAVGFGMMDEPNGRMVVITRSKSMAGRQNQYNASRETRSRRSDKSTSDDYSRTGTLASTELSARPSAASIYKKQALFREALASSSLLTVSSSVGDNLGNQLKVMPEIRSRRSVDSKSDNISSARTLPSTPNKSVGSSCKRHVLVGERLISSRLFPVQITDASTTIPR